MKSAVAGGVARHDPDGKVALGLISTIRPPAAKGFTLAEHLTRRTVLRVVAGVVLTALLASAAAASASAAPYAISDIGEAPSVGFKVSDIGAVPTAETATPPDDPPPTAGLAVSDIGPVTITDERTGGPITADTDPLGSSPAAVYPGQMVSVPS